MKISYVLPVYNAQASIANCIRSLLKQNIKPHEIIVIDDGSTDNTRSIIKCFEDKIIYLLFDERKGAAHCRNIGNETATGDIVAVCDADYYYPNRSDAINQFFKKEKDKAVFYSALILKDANNPHYKSQMDAYKWDFSSKCPISHPTIAYTSKIAKSFKYHEESIDTDLYEFFLLDIHKKGYEFGGTQTPLMIKTEGDSKRDVQGAKETIKKGMYKKYGITI